MLILWYTLTTFAGAALLFVVEPLVGRQILPILGGAPAVWVTCVLFFQAALLAGYAYAHLLVALVPRRLQPVIHALALAGAWAVLPLHPPSSTPDTAQAFPVLWLLGQLTRTLGGPFLVTSATAPLVQGWLGRSSHRHASDPYFLYAASNAGSLVALLSYPLAIEPLLSLQTQARWWSWGFALLGGLLLGCGLHVLVGKQRLELDAGKAPATRRPNAQTVACWLALAAVPSSLMLGVTTFSTTDVAPVPLLWVVPLALYLVTFIVAFMRRPLIAHATAMTWLPFAVSLVGLLRIAEVTRPIWLVLPAHFAAFFVIALACHGELARTRPDSRWLTWFYLVLSLGGVLGSAFNAIAAPLLFSTLAEYPIALVAASFVPLAVQGWNREQALTWQEIERQTDSPASATAAAREPIARALWREVAPAVGIAVVLAAVLVATRSLDEAWRIFLLAQLGAAAVAVALVYRSRPVRFAASLAAILLAPVIAARAVGAFNDSRSFFAVHRVVDDPAAQRRSYVQGTTVHGLQSTLPDRHRVPGAYYHRTGPAGDVLSRLHFREAGMIGLGVGSLAAYAESGQHITFFEIDPEVAAIAEDISLFTFLHDARERGAKVDVVLGDARLTLMKAPDGAFDLLVLDAYSSDVVPVHLLTREALTLYRRKLAPGGRILMNMSNRYLDLGLVVSALARDSSWSAFERTDLIETDEDKELEKLDGKAPSRWILLGQSTSAIESLGLGTDWKPLAPSNLSVWTDDYVNLVACVRW